MKRLIALAAPALLAACVLVPPPYSAAPLPAGTAIALDQSVVVGDVTVTPKAVVEDSRCPAGARCVWAGRLVVRTQIDGRGSDGARWRDTADVRMGETYGTHDKVIVLVSGEPGKTTGRETRPEDYRFVYEAGWYVRLDAR